MQCNDPGHKERDEGVPSALIEKPATIYRVQERSPGALCGGEIVSRAEPLSKIVLLIAVYFGEKFCAPKNLKIFPVEISNTAVCIK